jgi:flagellar assembly factor FliW
MSHDRSAVDTRFGTFTAGPDDVVHLVAALPGFDTCFRYVLLSTPAIEPFTCIQGLDEPRPSFLAIATRLVDPGHGQTLGAADREKLGAADDAALVWLALVRVDGERAFANLRAPLVINPRGMRGLQVLSADDRDAIDHPLPLD